MNFGRVIVEAWRVTRRTRPLRVLGLFSAIQIVLYTLVVGVLILPMSVLMQLLVSASEPGLSESSTAQQEKFATGALAASSWLTAHWTPVIFGIGALIAAWAVFGVLDVAATAGVITQTKATAQGRAASTAAGLRDGFGIWWRTAGLLAISALPSLFLMLAGAVFTLSAVTLPLAAGRMPSASVLRAGNLMTTPLSTIVTLANIPLGVLVALGLRFAVLDGSHWREAFGRAWRLARQRLADVALMYLVITAVVLASSLGLAVVFVIVLLVGIVSASLALAIGLTATSAPVIAIAVVTALVLLGGYLLFMVLVLVWQSVSWTVFWRELTGRTSAFESPPGVGHAPGKGAMV